MQERLSNLTDLNLTDNTIFGVNSNGNMEQFSVDTDFVNNYVKEMVCLILVL